MLDHLRAGALGGGLYAVVPAPESSWQQLGLAVLAAVLAAVLNWLSNRRTP